ncbi:hypothetical protein AB0436_15290, partial [Streptomyces sp. NPDC051322]
MHGDTAAGPGRGTVLLMSVAVGLCVASNYYAQPLLDTIARDLRLSSTSASLLVTAAQVGYALGVLTRRVVDAGDGGPASECGMAAMVVVVVQEA